IAGWAPSHAASAAVRALCERIVVGQRDEIALMQRWLRERHEPVPEADPAHYTMPGMDPSMLMPGMLTAEQLAQLDRARGAEFDRLFLTFMIQHHQGAITLVNQLFGSAGGREQETVFRFASDRRRPGRAAPGRDERRRGDLESAGGLENAAVGEVCRGHKLRSLILRERCHSGELQRLSGLGHFEPQETETEDRISLSGVTERRLRLQEPALRLR